MYHSIVLIHTPCYEITDDRLEPPLGVLYLATVLNQNGYKASISDLSSIPEENWEPLIPPADIYGFITFTPTYKRTLRILQLTRRINPSSKSIAGGPHASALPKQVAADFDFVVVGEGEQILLKLLRSLNNGNQPDSIQYEVIIQNLDSIPFPDYNLIDLSTYRRRVADQPCVGIISTRGCPYQCVFCASNIDGINRRIRYRSPRNFVNEIAQLKSRFGITSFKIQDDVFTLNLPRIREISRLLAPLEIVYRCNSRVDLCTKKEMLELLYASGCRHITFGVESGSPQMLERMNKRHTVTEVQTAIAMAKEAGLMVRANLLIGFPGESWETVQETIDFMRSCQPHEYVISALVPYPSTDTFHYPERYGILEMETDLSQYFMLRRNQESSYVFRTAELTPQAVSEMRAYMMQELSGSIGWVGTSAGYT